MKVHFFRILLTGFLGLLLFSCSPLTDNEEVDLQAIEDANVDDDDDDEPIDNSQFAAGLDCFGSGDYITDDFNLVEDLEIPDNLPSTYDLSEFLPPIDSQGQQPSCVSWAVTYYMKSMQEHIQSGIPYSSANIMSPSYTYNILSQGNCAGTNVGQTLEILKQNGVPSIADFPINLENCSTQPDESIDEIAENAKISDYKNLSGINLVLEMKTLIQQKTPIIISAYLSSRFGAVDEFNLAAYRPHAVTYNSGRCHAMLVVGYKDEYNAFKVVNSWGSNWGNGGFVWIDYAAFDNVLDTSAEFRVINEALIAYDEE